MTAKTFSSWAGPSWEKQWAKMIFISLGLHLFTLAIFLNIFPGGGTARKLEPTYVVNLVSFPGSGSIGNNPKTEQPFAAPSPPPPRMEPKPVSIPKPVPDKPLQVEDRSKTLDQAMEQLKKKVQQEKSLGKTLSRLEDRVKNEQTLEKALSQLEKKKQSDSPAGQGTGPGGLGNVSSFTPGMPDGSGIQLQLYHASLISRINKNWLLSEGLLKRKDISAVIVIHISRNGRIEDARFERKSGIEAFDQEVLRTIKKSDPLPPMPEGFPKNIYNDVGLTFSSKGLSGK
ncbi:MAG: TonB family protein [Deltaproteobacteria bacterium]|nr:TonB family protein [Deltaproteobacteria bacterium]